MENKEKKVKEVKETKKKGMNLPNKITCVRLALAVIVLVLLCLPWSSLGWSDESRIIPIMGEQVDIVMLIAGALFAIASFTDFLDGYIARKNNIVTDFGKVMDAIADKVLVNAILVILASTGFISPVIPVVIIVRDIVVDSIKMVAGNKGRVVAAIHMGKLKTACMMVGVTLTLFYNLPFELWNIRVSDALLIIAAVLSVVSAIQYFNMNKDLIFLNESKNEKVSE